MFAQDSAFGLGNFLAVQQVMGNLGGQKVNRILVPLSAQDFTPFAQQIKQQKTDLLFVAWAGTTAPAMWRALEQQGIFQAVDKVVTGLDQRSTYPTFGPVASNISFISHYVYNAPEEQGERLPRPLDAEAQPGARTCSRRTGSSPGRCSSVP